MQHKQHMNYDKVDLKYHMDHRDLLLFYHIYCIHLMSKKKKKKKKGNHIFISMDQRKVVNMIRLISYRNILQQLIHLLFLDYDDHYQMKMN